MDGARFANAVARLGCHPADVTWRAGVDALSFGFVKNGGLSAEMLIFFRPELADATLYRRKRAGHLLSKGRYMAAQVLAMLEGDVWLRNARAANDSAARLAGAAGDGCCCRSRRTRCSSGHARRGAGPARPGLRLLRLGSGRGAAGDELGQRPRRGRRAGAADRGAVTDELSPPADAEARAQDGVGLTDGVGVTEIALDGGVCEPERGHGSFTDPRVLIPFIAHHPDLGLDLDRDPGPARPRAGDLVGHLPLRDRVGGDVRLRGLKKSTLRIGREGHLLALGFGIPQFFLNFNFVYAAEHYITSGIVAVVFALLLVPNSLLARGCSWHRVTGRFLLGLGGRDGRRRPAVRERGPAERGPPEAVAIGIGLTCSASCPPPCPT
jgi:hypothetical protein